MDVRLGRLFVNLTKFLSGQKPSLRLSKKATGESRFTYVTAVTHLRGDKEDWENHAPFRDALDGNPVTILTFREMVTEIQAELTTTLAATEVGRMLQLFSAARMNIADT